MEDTMIARVARAKDSVGRPLETDLVCGDVKHAAPEQRLFSDRQAARCLKWAGTTYQPMSGMEGRMFTERFCERCTKDNIIPDTGEGGCEILADTMITNADDPDYPTAWIFGPDGHPLCTEFAGRPEAPTSPPQRACVEGGSDNDMTPNPSVTNQFKPGMM